MTTDADTAESVARQKLAHRTRVATMTAQTAAEVKAMSQAGGPDVEGGMPVVSGNVDEKFRFGEFSSQERIVKGRKNF